MATPQTAFRPLPAATVNISVGSSSASVALGVAGPTQVEIMNNGTATVWINWGLTGVTAALATGKPVGPGVHEVITIENFGGPLYMAAIAAGSTGSIYFTPGQGL